MISLHNLATISWLPITQELIDKYKSKKNMLIHLRDDKLTRGIMGIDETGKLVGYIAVNDEYIIGLWVAPEYRRQYIASYLLDEYALKQGVYTLTVNKNNTSAIELYKQCGFRIFDERNKFYYMHL